MKEKKLKREFKGIWIPKEIWLSDLSIQEKIFLAEIDSFHNAKGCFASNAYFSKFFQMSKARCSQIISNLKKKNLITIQLKMKGKQIIERRLIYDGLKAVNILREGSKNSKGGSKNLRSIDTSINNIEKENNKELFVANAPHVATHNIKSKYVTLHLFDKFWSLYPKRKNASKAKALTAWTKLCNKPLKERPKWKVIKKAIKSQKKSERWSKQSQYIPHHATWLNNNRWLDDASSLNEIDSYDKKNFTYHGGYKVTKKSSKM